MSPADSKRLGYRHTHREDHVKTQGEDRRLQAKESSLRRRRDLRLLTSRTEGNRFLLLEPPGLGHFVTAASADEDNQEFILWIRRQKKGKFYFCQDAAPEQHTHWWEVSSVRGPSGEVGPLQVQVHGFQQQEEISSSSYFLTTRQPRPITLGPCPCLGKHLQRITADTRAIVLIQRNFQKNTQERVDNPDNSLSNSS